MKFVLLQIGDTRDKCLINLIDSYVKKIQCYHDFDFLTFLSHKINRRLTKLDQKKEEENWILDHIKKTDIVILLDEKGKEYSSREFSVFLQKKMNTNCKRIVFVIGGAYGFNENIYNKVTEKVSLSKMTMNHQIVRLFFLEQLYRAFTILKNEPYHHD